MIEDFEDKNEVLVGDTESLGKNAEFENTFEEYIGCAPIANPEVANRMTRPCCCCCCCCRCIANNQGELVRNGGMETIINNRPRYWTSIGTGVSSETSSGRVHTGVASVNVDRGSEIEQRIERISSGKVYEFSFYAKGLTLAAGLTARVIFVTPYTQVNGAVITIRPLDMIYDGRDYGYYRILTIMAPRGTIAAIIRFTANGLIGQRVNIDDVSLSVK